MRATVSALLLIILSGCGGSSDGPPPANFIENPPLWMDYTLGFGETINLAEDVEVEFQAVEEDTRCPLDTQCITQGNARVRFKAITVRGATIVWLNTDPSLQTSTLFDYYGITLRKLEPYPSVDPQTGTSTIPNQDYEATVFVIKAATPQ
jgi:hypothetical protein